MNDGTLALMGASAGVGSVVGIWVERRVLRWRRKMGFPDVLVRTVYQAVDHITGATKTIDIVRATRRREIIQPHGRWMLTKRMFTRTSWRVWWADFRYPVPKGALGASPLPPLEVMGYWCEMGEHRDDWWIRYSTEAAAARPIFLDYLMQGHPSNGGGLCLALGYEWEPDMFRVEWDRANYRVRLTVRDRNGDGDVPTRPHMDVRSTA